MTKILLTIALITSLSYANAQTDSGSSNTSSGSNSSSSGSNSSTSSNDQVVEEITCVAEDLKRMIIIRMNELRQKSAENN